KGFECLIKVLNFEYVETADEKMLFKVSQSVIATLTFALLNNRINKEYFLQNLKFDSLFDPLYKLNFIKHYNFGLHLVLNLFQLSVMNIALYDEEKLHQMNDDDVPQTFKQKCKTETLIFINPEVIPEVLL